MEHDFWNVRCFLSTFYYQFLKPLPLQCVVRCHWRCYIKKTVLKNLEYFTGKRLCWSLFLKKLQTFSKACNIIKKRLQNRCFPVKFTKFLRTPILKNIYERLLLCCFLTALIFWSKNRFSNTRVYTFRKFIKKVLFSWSLGRNKSTDLKLKVN